MGRVSSSGYCQTCRRRRVKCDRGTPACQRCIKAGYTCEGYGMRMRMQHMGVSTTPAGGSRLARISSSPPAPGPTPGLSLVAFRDSMCFTFFFSTCSWSHSWRPVLQIDKDASVLALDYECTLAAAYAYFGIQQHNKDIENRGREIYGRCLREVMAILGRGDKFEMRRMILAVLILGMITYIIDGEPRLQHYVGVVHILEHCGPESFQQEPFLTAFRSCRALLTCKALARRERTIFEQQRWKTIPFEVHPQDSADSLLSIVADLPGLARATVEFHATRTSAVRSALLSKIDDISTQMQSWRGKRGSPGGDDHDLRADTPDPTDKLQTLGHAAEIFTYHSAVMFVLQIRDALGHDGRWGGPLCLEDMNRIMDMTGASPASPLLQPDAAKFTCRPALEALRIFPYLHSRLMTEKVGKRRVLMALAPIGIVYCALHGQPDLLREDSRILAMPFFDEVSPMLRKYEAPGNFEQI